MPERRRFLAAGLALGAAALLPHALSGVASAATGHDASPADAAQNRHSPMPQRMLGSLDVSAIGLGCLPMVGYYGGT